MSRPRVTRRRFGAAVFGARTAVAAASLAACVPGQERAAAPGPRRDYTGITIQHAGAPTAPPNLRTFQRVIAELFEPAHPGIKVEGIPGELPTVLTGLAAGTPPDASNLDEYFMPGLVKKGALLELGPYQVKDKTFNPRDMFEGAWRAGQYRAKQYGISPGVFGPLLKYNKDHFDEAGLPYPPGDYKQGGWTWNRMREDAKKLTKRDASGQLVRAGFGFDARFFSRFSGHFYSYGTQVVDRLDDPTKCVLDEPQNLELIQLLYDMTNADRTAPPADWYEHGTGWRVGIPGNNEILFRQGKLALSIELQELANTRKVDGLRWDYAPLPRPNNNGKPGNFIGSNVFIGLKATRYPDVIWDWIAALGSTKHAEWKMRDPDLLAVPAWKPLRAEYARLTPPDNIRAYIDLGEYGTTSIMTTEYDELQNAILQGLRPVWNREAPVRQTVMELVRKINDVLKQAQN